MSKDITEEVKAIVADACRPLADAMQKSNERVDEMDSRINDLRVDGEEGQVRARWFDSLSRGMPEIVPHDMKIDQYIERAVRNIGRPTVNVGGQKVGVYQRYEDVPNKEGLRYARFIRAQIVAKNEGLSGLEGVKAIAQRWGDPMLGDMADDVKEAYEAYRSGDDEVRAMAQRVLGTVTGSEGGFFAPAAFGSAIIDYMHPMSAVRPLGPMILPMNTGSIETPYLDTAANARYQGENRAGKSTDPKPQLMTMTAKKLIGDIVVSRELLADSAWTMDVFFMTHLARVMAAREDLAFIRGDGTQNTPRGMKWLAAQDAAKTEGNSHVITRTVSGGVPTVATLSKDIMQGVTRIEDGNNLMLRMGMILRPRTVNGLIALRNSTNSAEVFPELRGGTFFGMPYRKSTQIPQTLTKLGTEDGYGTANKTEAYLADFSTLVIGERQGLAIEARDGAAYTDASGATVAGFSHGQVVIQGTMRHDFNSLHSGKDTVMFNDIDWGSVVA